MFSDKPEKTGTSPEILYGARIDSKKPLTIASLTRAKFYLPFDEIHSKLPNLILSSKISGRVVRSAACAAS